MDFMNINFRKIDLVLILFAWNTVIAQSSFQMVTYNLLQYDGYDRNEYLRTVMDEIDPDLIVVQEIESQVGIDSYIDIRFGQRIRDDSISRWVYNGQSYFLQSICHGDSFRKLYPDRSERYCRI
jgi:hypothetical protein